MVKLHKLHTRAFGSEPRIPDVTQLAEWIAENRGTMADITTYQLYQSLTPQLAAGIEQPCAGGKFCTDRIRSSLLGVEGNCINDEIAVMTEVLIEDAAGIVVQKRNCWCALPAPHALGLIDRYYHDIEEWSAAITGAYCNVMRAMRDIGIAGHVLLANHADDMEFAALSDLKVFFFFSDIDRKGMERLMEYQRHIAVRSNRLELVFDLMNEYDVRKIYVVDPDAGSINLALSHFDPEQVNVGGYCLDKCEEYWKNLGNAAVYP